MVSIVEAITRTRGGVICMEAKLHMVGHLVLHLHGDNWCLAFAAVVWEGISDAESAAIREAKSVELRDAIELSLMGPVLGCWYPFEEGDY